MSHGPLSPQQPATTPSFIIGILLLLYVTSPRNLQPASNQARSSSHILTCTLLCLSQQHPSTMLPIRTALRTLSRPVATRAIATSAPRAMSKGSWDKASVNYDDVKKYTIQPSDVSRPANCVPAVQSEKYQVMCSHTGRHCDRHARGGPGGQQPHPRRGQRALQQGRRCVWPPVARRHLPAGRQQNWFICAHS